MQSFSVREAARILGVHESRVYRWIKERKLKTTRRNNGALCVLAKSLEQAKKSGFAQDHIIKSRSNPGTRALREYQAQAFAGVYGPDFLL